MLPQEMHDLTDRELSLIEMFIAFQAELANDQIADMSTTDFERKAVFAGQMHQLRKEVKRFIERREDERADVEEEMMESGDD